MEVLIAKEKFNKKKRTTVVISNRTLDIFNKLYVEHHQMLSCVCSTITIHFLKYHLVQRKKILI